MDISKEIMIAFCSSPSQIENVTAYYDNNCNSVAAAKATGKNQSGILRSVKLVKSKVTAPIDTPLEAEFDVKEKVIELSGRYKEITSQHSFSLIITSAQNSTPVHANFFKNLLAAKKELHSEFLVIPWRYKNPTSVFLDEGKDYWAQELNSYLCEDDFNVNENLCILGQLKSQPTAKRPLTGLESVSGSRSAIFGHAKLEMKCVATPGNRMAKTLITTGCCTIENYTDSTAGYKGRSQHSFSALYIEVKGKAFFIRQLVADENGDFIDMLTEYKNGIPRPAGQPQVLATGDLHGVNSDPQAVAATFTNHDSMLNYFKPKFVTIDDTVDFERSHHIKKDPVAMAQLIRGGHTVENELKYTFNLIDSFIVPKGTVKVIKRSNHDEHMERWVKETDPRSDPINYDIWCESYPLMINNVDIFKHFGNKMLSRPDEVRFLMRDEIFNVGGVNHDGHGDLGSNGSRGSLNQFTKLGTPGQWGHSHTPGIQDDQYQHGTLSKLKLAYVRGPSSWLHCNTIQYANGKRSHLFIIDGAWKF